MLLDCVDFANLPLLAKDFGFDPYIEYEMQTVLQ
jgi:hypothetical protein